MENAISREDAMRSMTIWAAHSAFEEGTKGSLEAGKWADYVILEKDLMTMPEEEMREMKVLETVINGETVFSVRN